MSGPPLRNGKLLSCTSSNGFYWLFKAKVQTRIAHFIFSLTTENKLSGNCQIATHLAIPAFILSLFAHRKKEAKIWAKRVGNETTTCDDFNKDVSCWR